MAEPLYTFSKDDVELLRQVIAAERKRVHRPSEVKSPAVNLNRGVYLASPVTNVPEYSDSGSTQSYEFKIKKFVNVGDLSDVESTEWEIRDNQYGGDSGTVTIMAFNTSNSDLSPDKTYILAMDMWGKWIVLLSEGGGGTSGMMCTVITPIRCPRFVINSITFCTE